MQTFMQRRPRLSLGISLALALGIAGSGTTAFLQRSSARQSATVTMSSYTSQPDDLRIIAQHSDLVLEGTIEQVEPGRWTTPNGQPPQDIKSVLADPSSDIQLRTPVRLRIDRMYKGNYPARVILFTLPGGSLEQTTAVFEDHADAEAHERRLQSGTKVIVFLSHAPAHAGAWSKISPFYPQLYLVVDGDTLHGPLKPLRRSTFIEQFGSGQN